MERRSRMTVVSVAVVALGLLAGCAPAGDAPDGASEITFMGWGSPQEVEVFETMIDQYEDAYPDVTVKYITVPDADFATKLQTMMASGQTPDVFYVVPDNLLSYVDNGVLADMTDYIGDNDLFEENNIWPAALATYRTDGERTGVGQAYALPKDVGPWALAYNEDMFDAAGITPAAPDALWTWDDFLAAAKKLTSGEGASKVYGTAAYSLESAVWSNGADWLSDDLTDVTVTDPAFVEALQWVADLSLVEGVAPSQEAEESLGSTQRFVDSGIGMMGIGPWSQAQLWAEAEFEWDIMPWPVSPRTGDEAVWIGGIGFGVSAKTENPEAAMNLAAFLSVNEDAQRTNMEMGQAVPNLIDMATDEFLTMDKAPANKAEFLRIIQDYGRVPTQTKTYDPQWYNTFSSGVAAVYAGDMTAAEYAASIEPEMQKLLDEGIAKQQG